MNFPTCVCGNQLNDQLTLELEDCLQGKGGCGCHERGGLKWLQGEWGEGRDTSTL